MARHELPSDLLAATSGVVRLFEAALAIEAIRLGAGWVGAGARLSDDAMLRGQGRDDSATDLTSIHSFTASLRNLRGG